METSTFRRIYSKTAAILAVLAMTAGSVQAFEYWPLQIGPVKVGGALRYNYVYRDWAEGQYGSGGGEVDFDTARINLSLDKEQWIGALEYRFYRPEAGSYKWQVDNTTSDNDYWYSMLHHGWLGYRFDDSSEVHVGVHQVPFGIQPYASHNWFFQLAYYVGLEDDYDLGIKYIKKAAPWTLKLAYYVQDEGHYFGRSNDSARYSYDLVEDPCWDGTSPANEEDGQVNARLTYTLAHGEKGQTEFGLSGQYGLIENGNSGDHGDHYALGLHTNTTYNRWNVMAQTIRYEYSPENVPALDTAAPYQDGSYVVMGAYDAPYRVASKGWVHSLGVSYKLPINNVDWIDSITFYDDYSILVKDESDWSDSQQNVLGAMIASGGFYIYCDIASGKNNPWLGPGWTNSLANTAGETNDWDTRFNINVGYYF